LLVAGASSHRSQKINEKADIGYRELAERLKKHGLKETGASIANKISRGTFSATFLLASLKAIEADTLRLEDI
jgi:uncharacterized protein DUF6471